MIKAMKQWLEALETVWYHVGTFAPTDDAIELYNQAKTSLRQAIAEAEKQEQGEPVQVTIKDFVKAVEGKEDLMGRPVYWAQWPNGNTTPQPRKPLTDEQIVSKALHLSGLGTSPDVLQFARAIEAAHGIKE